MLRPLLHRRLLIRLGEVKVAHQGEAFVARMGTYRGRPSLNVSHYGEAYRVCCPFCGDTRHRLWVNHMWGYYDELAGGRNLWLARCYNEECLKDRHRQRRLYDEVFHDVRSGRGNLADDRVFVGETVDPDSMPDRVCPPGELVYLHELEPSHPARVYMQNRGYDPDVFSRELGVSYCPLALPQFSRASGRIIIPVVMNGQMVGWQARLIAGAATKDNPKYVTMTGMRKSMTLYNYDNALTAPFVVVFEGPTKVWRFGREAVALLGDTISGWQTQKLIYWGREMGKPIVVFMDGNAQDKAWEIYDALDFVPRKVLVPSEGDFDPGDVPTHQLRAMVREHALAAGIKLPI